MQEPNFCPDCGKDMESDEEHENWCDYDPLYDEDEEDEELDDEELEDEE